MRDIFVVVAPGMGKTTILLGPLLAAQDRGQSGIALIIVPTKLIAEQQATLAQNLGLYALAINEDTVREANYAKKDLIKDLRTTPGVRLGIMSPQMLSSTAMQEFIGDHKIKRLIRWFLIDEVHLYDEESGVWLVPYQALRHMHARLLSSTVWAAVTGTATPSRALHIASGLGFKPGFYDDIRCSVDRNNIKFIPRFFEHPYTGHTILNLSFLIPFGISTAADIPTTLVFCDTIHDGVRVMRFLDSLIPDSIPGRTRLVRLYNSVMPRDYRKNCMLELREGLKLRILVYTDTCTYGLDLPNIRRGVNIGIPASIEVLVQRLNRVGRDGQPAEVYTFAPEWVREIPAQQITTIQQREDANRREKLTPIILRWFNPTSSLCPRQAYLEYNEEKLDTIPTQCCLTHVAEPQASDWEATVSKWKALLDGAEPQRATGLRTDKTYPTLDSKLKAVALRILRRWRHVQWMALLELDPNASVEMFMPSLFLERLSERPHLCSMVERMEHVLNGWDRTSAALPTFKAKHESLGC